MWEKKKEIRRDQLLKAEKQKEEKINFLYQTLLYSITKEQPTIKKTMQLKLHQVKLK